MAYIFKKRLANKANYGSKRVLSRIKYIVIHYTANDGDSDEGNGNYFANHIVQASAHYFVDGDSITQSVPDDYVAYSVGDKRYADCNKTGGGKFYCQCTNLNSISIELCDEARNGKYDFSPATIENAVELIKSLMNKYGISIDRVIRHFDVSGKNCPAPFVDNTRWKEFKNKITESGDLTVSQYEELIKEIISLRKKVESLEKSTEKVYNYTIEIPEWGRPTIQKLLDKGLYKGASESDLNLPENLLRTLVINDRAGLYD
jgi:N-acetylmuramoyl-L-alanine amidase